jgi:hypothetical protein
MGWCLVIFKSTGWLSSQGKGNCYDYGNIIMAADSDQNFYWRAGGMGQVVECLPTKHEALSSSPSTAKKTQTTATATTEFLLERVGGTV